MGTADKIMDLSPVSDFIQQLLSCCADARLETEEGWSHEQTCMNSYTSARLSWIFSL